MPVKILCFNCFRTEYTQNPDNNFVYCPSEFWPFLINYSKIRITPEIDGQTLINIFFLYKTYPINQKKKICVNAYNKDPFIFPARGTKIF